MKELNLGIQLYSVREEIEKYGLDEVLGALSEAGCDTVEFAGFYSLTPKEMKEKLEKYNLKPLSAHIALDGIVENLPFIDELKIEAVYIPWYDKAKLENAESYEEFKKKVSEVKPELDRRGVKLGYHNHAHELTDCDLLDRISTDTGISLELDIYWATAAAKVPTELIKKYGKRLTALHIKDMHKAAVPSDPTKYPNAIIGEGQCEAEKAFNAAVAEGVDTFILEVEYYPCDYKEYIKKSIDNIKKFSK